MAKPFSPKELVARVRAVLRRASGPLAGAGQRTAACSRTATSRSTSPPARPRLAGEVVPLTAREFELLVFLMRHPRQAFRREELLQQVWGSRYGDTSTITVHVRRLREKIEPDPAAPDAHRDGVGRRLPVGGRRARWCA